MILGSFQNVVEKTCLQIIFLIYVYKEDMALNNLQWLVCLKTKPNLSHLKIVLPTNYSLKIIRMNGSWH